MGENVKYSALSQPSSQTASFEFPTQGDNGAEARADGEGRGGRDRARRRWSGRGRPRRRGSGRGGGAEAANGRAERPRGEDGPSAEEQRRQRGGLSGSGT